MALIGLGFMRDGIDRTRNYEVLGLGFMRVDFGLEFTRDGFVWIKIYEALGLESSTCIYSHPYTHSKRNHSWVSLYNKYEEFKLHERVNSKLHGVLTEA